MVSGNTVLAVGADERLEAVLDELATTHEWRIRRNPVDAQLEDAIDGAISCLLAPASVLATPEGRLIDAGSDEPPETPVVGFHETGAEAESALDAGADAVVRIDGDSAAVAREANAVIERLVDTASRSEPAGKSPAEGSAGVDLDVDDLLLEAADHLSDMLYVIDFEGSMLAWNETLTRVTGYDDDAVAEMAPVEFVVEEDRDEIRAAIEQVLRAGEVKETGRILTADGDRIPYEFTGKLLEVDGEPVALAGIGRDVTERRRRERGLERQAERLRELNHVNQVIRDVNEALVRAETREEIERAVCEHLASAEPYRFAWIGDVDPTTAGVEPKAAAGEGADYLDVRPTDAGNSDDVTAGTAVAEDEVIVAQRIADDPDYAAWRDAAIERGFESAAAIPLSYRGRSYGALCVYAPRPEAFAETERTVLGELGETIAYAISVAERRRALLSDTVVELDLAFPEPGPFVVAASEATDGEVSLQGVVESGDSLAAFLRADASDLDALRRHAAEVGADLTVVTEGGEECVVRVVPERRTVAEIVADRGGVLVGATGTDGSGEATVELPGAVDVRSILDRIRSVYPATQLRAKAERARTGPPDAQLRTGLEQSLTDRQQEVLESAYHAGFFEWPRTASAKEIAATLDISPPTFHEHLRRVEAKLVRTYLDAQYSTS
ncbi:bacterio-opsin activator domain-containing protein [Haloparvum sp. PAK95]|uniref:bacterio-opsin activator domain-containing protein n=1 Tax=Haloparvum sp. PAK95 TaxID=3418962 RepID=UPI003D2F318C